MSDSIEAPAGGRGDDQFAPCIIVDTRKQLPLPFRHLQSITATLTTGDYSVAGLEELFSVERKSVADLVGCCTGDNRARFERELHRLRGFRFKRLLIVGSRLEVTQHRYRSNLSPKAILSTLAAFEVRYDTPVVWSPTPEESARLVEGWAWWFARETVKAAKAVQCPGSSGKAPTPDFTSAQANQ